MSDLVDPDEWSEMDTDELKHYHTVVTQEPLKNGSPIACMCSCILISIKTKNSCYFYIFA